MEAHPSSQELDQLARGALREELAQRVRRHLDECADCRARYEGFLADAGLEADVRAAMQDDQTLPSSFAGAESQSPDSPDQLTVEVGDSGSTRTTPHSTNTMLNQTIGPYRILRTIGEGGMGIVFEADQEEPIRRHVALKLIKLGMDTSDVIARFESERQALAMMNHPNVAKVLDAGATPEGRPYFVMEFVHGVPLTQHCDRHKLPIEERLDLFIQICEAVQHAHQKGIIHRDLKPGNILVEYRDDKAVPKVIDFGIAKATNQRLSEHTVFTQFGQLVGTPQYMSPEQADPTTQDIDTRSDVYSLGVILYELLSGQLPFDPHELLSAGYAEIQRILREVEPHRPSTRISELSTRDTDTSSTLATSRRTDVRSLTRLLRGDLDWIVMKCLEKDRSRRYETASSLAQDVQRHLNNEPVMAGPPSASYRMRKFVRRNRGGVFAAALVTCALVLGIIGTTWGMVWAMRERRRADGEAAAARQAEMAASNLAELESEARAEADAKAEEARQLFEGATTLNDLLGSLIYQSVPMSGAQGDTAVFDRLTGQASAFLRSADLPAEVELRMRRTIAGTLLRRRRDDMASEHEERIREILDELDADPRTVLEYETALAADAWWGAEREARLARFRPLVESIATDLPLDDSARACAFVVLGRFQQGEAALRSFEEVLRATPEALPRSNSWWWIAREGVVFHRGLRDDPFAAIAELEALYEAKIEAIGPTNSDIGSVLGSLRDLYIKTSDAQGIQRTFERAVDHTSRVWGAHGGLTISAHTYYAGAFRAIGDHESAKRLLAKALQLLQQRYGEGHPRVLEQLRDLALEELRQGRPDAAADLLQQIEGDIERALGQDLLRTGRVVNTYVDACRRAGRLDRVNPWLDSLTPLLEQYDYRDEADAAAELAYAMGHARLHAVAERIATMALESIAQGGSATTVAHVNLWRALGWVRLNQGNVDGAILAYTASMNLIRNEPDWLTRYEWAIQDYAWVLSNHKGDHKRALEMFREIAAAQREVGNIEPARMAWNEMHQANMLRLLGRYDEALASLDRGARLAVSTPELLGHITQNRGITLLESGDAPGAIEAYGEAIEILRPIGSEESERRLCETLHWLAWQFELASRYDEAWSRYRELRDALSKRNASEDEIAGGILAQGRVLLKAGRWAEAEAALVAADEAIRDGEPEHMHRRGESLHLLVQLHEQRDDMESEAREAALQVWRERSQRFHDSKSEHE